MALRYPPVVVLLGAMFVGASAFAGWPVDDTAALGVELSITAVLVALSMFFIVLAVASLSDALDRRSFTAGVLVVAIVTAFLGAYGYGEVIFADIDGFVDELVALAPPVMTILGAAIATIGAVCMWFTIELTSARRRLQAAALMLLVGFGGLIAMIVWANILFVVLLLFVGREPTLAEGIAVSNIALGLGMGSVALAYLLVANRDWSFIDLKRPSLVDVVWMVVGVGGLLVSLIVIGAILQLLGTPPAEHGLVEDILEEGDPEVVLYVLIPASILLIGPGEELLFRNIIQKSLYDHFSRPAAVVVASILFALAHVPAYWAGADTVTALIVITVLSLVLGGIYAKTENLLVPAIIHGLYNAILFAALYLDMTMDTETLSLLGIA